MIKFEKKFLYTFADIAAARELIGKEGLFFDEPIDQEDLHVGTLDVLGDAGECKFPFRKADSDFYRFFYCDPNLECKRAFYLEGKEIQSRVKNSACKDWNNCPRPMWDDGIEYRIKPETETRLTNREVAEWLAKGNGEILSLDNMRNHILNYSELAEKLLCECKIRKWSDSEWHEATKEYVSEVAE